MERACICNTHWRDLHLDVMPMFSDLLQAANYVLKFSSAIIPDFILNTSGVSTAYIVVTNWEQHLTSSLWERVAKMGSIFRYSYALITIPSDEANSKLIDSYFSSEFTRIGNPPFIPSLDNRLTGEKMLQMAQVHAEVKQQGTSASLESEQLECVQSAEALVTVLTSIPGLDSHEANSLLADIGSIEAISHASKEVIVGTTDLSAEKADLVVRFFCDGTSKFTPKFDWQL